MEEQPLDENRVVNGLRYRTSNATLLAYYKVKIDGLWNYFYLFRTPNNNYFQQRHDEVCHSDPKRGGWLKPLSESEAIDFYGRTESFTYGEIIEPDAFNIRDGHWCMNSCG